MPVAMLSKPVLYKLVISRLNCTAMTFSARYFIILVLLFSEPQFSSCRTVPRKVPKKVLLGLS